MPGRWLGWGFPYRGHRMTDHITSACYKVTEVKISYRNKTPPNDRTQINTSNAAYLLLLRNWDRNKIEMVEQFKIILLNNHNDCLGISEISTGGVTSCIVEPKVIFATAVNAFATKIILTHNHPSGSIRPSLADLRITDKLKQGGKLLDIDVVDHLIITPYSYYSMADDGMMPG